MNRVSVLLLCITTLAIYFIIAKKPELDIKRYEDQIAELEQKVLEREKENDSLQIKSLELEKAIAAYDVIIENFRNQIYDIKRDAQEKVDAVDNFGDDQLEQFFAERYKRLIESEKDSIN